MAVARESSIDGLGGVHRAHSEKALAHEIADFRIGLGAIPGMAVSGKIVEFEGAERPDVREGLERGISEVVAGLGAATRVACSWGSRPGRAAIRPGLVGNGNFGLCLRCSSRFRAIS